MFIMKWISIHMEWLSLLVLLFGLEWSVCGCDSVFKSVPFTVTGMLLVVFVYFALKRFRSTLSKELYSRLGFDLLYEFLSGKRGVVRQFFGIWILVMLPFAIFEENSPEQCPWIFTLLTTLIETLWLYFALDWKALK